MSEKKSDTSSAITANVATKLVGGLSMVTLIHMAIEVMVVAAVFFTIKRKTSALQVQIDKLNEKIAEQDAMLAQHHNILLQIMNGNMPQPSHAPPPQMSRVSPTGPPQHRQPVNTKPVAPRQQPPTQQQPSNNVQPPVKNRSNATPSPSSKPTRAPPKKTRPVYTVQCSETDYTDGEPDEDTLDAIIQEEFEKETVLNCDVDECNDVKLESLEKKKRLDVREQ